MRRTWYVLTVMVLFGGMLFSGEALADGALTQGNAQTRIAALNSTVAAVPNGEGEQKLGDIPGLTVTTPAPDWIQPGLRLTYYTISGTLPNGPHEYVADPNGTWGDQRGNSYSRKSLRATGSNGLFQFNIAAMDQQRAVVQMLFYLYDGVNATESRQALEAGYVAPVGTGGDLWMHPEALTILVRKYGGQPALSTEQPGMWASKVRKTIDQATYDAVLLVLVTQSSRKLWMYDSASGVLLYSSEISKTSAVNTQNDRLSPGGSTVRFTTFKGSRTLQLPWAGQPAPNWLASANTFEYSGTFQVTLPGSPATPLPFNLGISVQERGRDWLQYRVNSTSQALESGAELTARVGGNTMLCGSWIPPAALGMLQTGQVVDTDGFTHVTTRVGYTDSQGVTLVADSQRQQIHYTYRRNDGLLVRLLFIDRLNQLGMSKQIELSLRSMQ
nr:hypothetical protein [uncultured Desulfobulbus sp.]